MQLEDTAADAPLLRAISQSFDAPVPLRIGVAVSGGGDSVALLHLFARWAAQTGHGIAAVTVDHRLRPESAAEAQGVAALCAKLNISHDILEWQGHHGAGNLPAAAREGRYGLMAGWARAQGIGGIVLGHTQDDGWGARRALTGWPRCRRGLCAKASAGPDHLLGTPVPRCVPTCAATMCHGSRTPQTMIHATRAPACGKCCAA